MLEPPVEGAEPQEARPPKRARTAKSDKFLSYPVIATRRTAASAQRAVEEAQDVRLKRLGTEVPAGAASKGGGEGRGMGGGGGGEEKEGRSCGRGEEAGVDVDGEESDGKDSFVNSGSRMEDEGLKKHRGEGAWAGSECGGGVGGDGEGLSRAQLGRSVEIELGESRTRKVVGRDDEVHGIRNDAKFVNSGIVSLPNRGADGGGKKGKVKVSYKDLVKELLR